jgi:hypothetical protein
MILAPSKLKVVANASGSLGGLTAYGARGRIVTSGPQTDVLATFGTDVDANANDSSAIVRTKVGSGSVTQFAFLPQIHYRFMDPYHPSPEYNSPTNYSDGSLPYLLQFVTEEAGVQPDVYVSEPLVETPLLLSSGGAALTLLNWQTHPIAALEVNVRLGFEVRSVESTATSQTRQLQFKCKEDGTNPDGKKQFVTTFTLALEHGDFVLLTF